MARYFKDPYKKDEQKDQNFEYVVLGDKDPSGDHDYRPAGRVTGYYSPEKNTDYFAPDKTTGQLNTTLDWKYSKEGFDGGSPTTLFGYSPAKLHINEAFFHPSMRAHAIPLLSRIAADYPKFSTIEASDSLSQHSSKLVKGAQEAGFPVSANPHNPNAEVTNDLGFRTDSQMPFYQMEYARYGEPAKEISSEDMRAAMQPVRNQLRANRAARMSEQVNSNQFQPHLPGMENF